MTLVVSKSLTGDGSELDRDMGRKWTIVFGRVSALGRDVCV